MISTSEAEPSRLRPENLAELTNDQFDEVSCFGAGTLKGGRAALGTPCASPSGPQDVFSTENFDQQVHKQYMAFRSILCCGSAIAMTHTRDELRVVASPPPRPRTAPTKGLPLGDYSIGILQSGRGGQHASETESGIYLR